MKHSKIKWKNTGNDELYEELSKEKYKSKYANRQDSEYQSKAASTIWENEGYEEQQAKVLDALAKGREGGASQRGGLTNVETGHIQELGKTYWKDAMEASLERITCEVCGQDANTGNYAKWHGKKCKHNEIMEVFNRLPEEFTRKDVKLVIEELGAPQNFLRKIVNDNYLDMIECFYKGTNGSMYDVPRYRKIIN